jgi:hypothetical protein
MLPPVELALVADAPPWPELLLVVPLPPEPLLELVTWLFVAAQPFARATPQLAANNTNTAA